MPNAPWVALAPLVLVSYSILIQNWCQMAPGLPWFIMYWFPFQFSFKFDVNAPWAALAPYCIGFLFNSYSKVKPNAHWAALAPLVLVSYSILIQH